MILLLVCLTGSSILHSKPGPPRGIPVSAKGAIVLPVVQIRNPGMTLLLPITHQVLHISQVRLFLSVPIASAEAQAIGTTAEGYLPD